ncbi:hypothetical protein FI667_g12831, partial [Globisporangium splendens]
MKPRTRKSRPLAIPVRSISVSALHTTRQKYATTSAEERKSIAQPSPPGDKPTSRRSFKKLSLSHVFRLLYRMMVLLAALGYVGVSFKATADALVLLRGRDGEVVSKDRVESNLLEHYVGTTTLRVNPFVVEILENNTTPRNNATIYISSSAGGSFDACDVMTPAAEALYAPAVRFDVPIVDCDSPSLREGIESRGVYNFLVRSTTDFDDTAIVTVNFATQIYKILHQRKSGSARLGTVTFVKGLRAASVSCHYIVSIGYPYEAFNFRVHVVTGLTARGAWHFENIPNGDITDLSKPFTVGTRSGFFVDSDAVQANIFTERWLISSNPIEAITGSEWKLWVGDALVAVSSRTTLRGILVLMSCRVNGFWSLFEFCIYEGNEISKVTTMKIYEWIIYADLLTTYFFVCGVLGMLFRERIDPLFATLSFTLGFQYRIGVQSWFPRVVAKTNEFSVEFYNNGMRRRIEEQSKISPMQFWAPHKLTTLPPSIIFSTLFPIFSTLGFVVVYIVFQKLRRRWTSQRFYSRNVSGRSSKSLMQFGDGKTRQRLEQQTVLTLFEIATGATLANRFGLLAEYDNCMFIKGMKFATPDGIYNSGFVIANEKFLVHADDI